MSGVRARVGHAHLSAHRQPARPLWDRENRGSEVVALATALTLTAAATEITLTSHLGLFFDMCFVAVCLVAATTVRPRDFFTVGVMPPLLLLATMLLVALNGTHVIAARGDSIVQAVISGLAHHSVALFVGYAASLVTLVLRRRTAG